MMKRPYNWLIASVTTVVVSMAVIVIIQPVWGIDFVGGSLMELESPEDRLQEMRSYLQGEFDLSATIQSTPDGTVLVRTQALDQGLHEEVLQGLRDTGLLEGEEVRFESIGPTIGAELRRKAGIAVLVTVIVMIAYLAYTFRGASGLVSPWKFGVAAAWALVQDLLVVMAIFVIFGKLWDVPIDSLFVTAQLAILGYSVNDTIVLFNRMKSEWVATRSGNLLSVMDPSIRATLIRSINTSLTTLLVLITLLVFGGGTIRWFIVALALGTIAGTYSSIFVASPALYWLAKRRG